MSRAASSTGPGRLRGDTDEHALLGGRVRVYEMAELLRGYLPASRKHRLIVPVRLPGTAARAFRAGAKLAPERAVGGRTWEEFLADRLGPSSDSTSRLPEGGWAT